LPRQPLLEQEPIARLIAATRRRIKQAVGRRLRTHGLSPQQFWLLVNLEEGVSLRDLARRLHMDEPTASRIVSGLVQRRLVKVDADPDDRRRRALGRTPSGAVLTRTVQPIADEVRRAVEAGFTASEKDALRLFLVRVMENMGRLEDQDQGIGARKPRKET
jgi:DNA-binding MarR family transcriptional regulator